MKYKKILVLGATGGTGKWLVQMALENGHQVTALVRPTAEIGQHDGLEIVRGDVLDAAALKGAMKGQQAVMSCLGIGRKNSSSPWSPLLSSTDFTAMAAKNIIGAMQTHGLSRLVALSAAGAGDSWDKVDMITQLLIRKSKLALTIGDSSNMERIFANAALDSLVVRPVRLVDGPATNRARIIERGKISAKISRSDVATWMLNALERPEPFENRSEMIGWT